MLRLFDKPFLPFADQVALLKSRGLSFADESCAEEFLAHCNYYRFSGYTPTFQETPDKFIDGTTFEQIIALYHFDEQLRQLTLEAITQIEVSARTRIAYHLAQRGAFAHTEAKLFNDRFRHSEWIYKLRETAKKSHEPFVAHFKKNYQQWPDLPIWGAVELMSLGELSCGYQHLQVSTKMKIAAEYAVPEPILTSWLHSISFARNLCAHHSRLWNRFLSITPQIPRSAEWTKFCSTNPHYSLNHKPFCMLTILNFLLRRITFKTAWQHNSWKERLCKLLNNPPSSSAFCARNGNSSRLANAANVGGVNFVASRRGKHFAFFSFFI